MEPQQFKTIRGYELRDQIGAGGFGAVYRAFQPIIEREVAIKSILPQFTNNADFIRNFEAEAHLIAHLEHPFIVPLFDYWRDPEGAYLVMRYYAPGSLRQLLQKQGAIPALRVAEMLMQLAGALDTAHRHHVIHRDVKPENILLDEEGNAYIADFGIAKKTDPDKGNGTDKESFSGTLAYASPEVLRREGATTASDIYSLGYVAYEMLTGKHAFGDQSPVLLLMSQMERELPIIENLPIPAMSALLKATAKAPAERYTSARSLALDFQQALGQPVPEPSIPILVPEDVVNPYKGLRPFNEADADDFFGRDGLVQQLLDRLGSNHPWHNFLAVVGPSGSGKSSVVHAGLLPALRAGKLPHSDEWFYLTMTPGPHPLQQLRTVLRSIAIDPHDTLSGILNNNPQGLVEALQDILDIKQDLFLVVDQFEEVFTLVEDERERQQFLTLLYHAANSPGSHLRIVVTLRADFYDKPLLYEDFGALMQAQTQVVLPLSTGELEQAIAGPAQRVALTIDSDLVAAIVADVRQEPGALPLLQYALTEVFEHRERHRLNLAAYQKSGGILGALAGRADEVYNSLHSDQQAIAQQVFLRLVAPGEGTEDTRRRARYSELTAFRYSRDTLQSVLDAFGKYRLLTFDRDSETREPTIEIAHEALIRSWSRLRGWLDYNRNDIRLQRMLAIAQEDWQRSGQDTSYLLGGAKLAQFEEWAKSSNLALSQEERAFLDVSLDEFNRQKTLETERQAHELRLERRSRQRLQLIVGILVIASIAGIALTFAVYQQSRIAQQERDNALRAADIANSETLATKAQQAASLGDSTQALTLALQAASIDDPPQDLLDTLIDVAYAPGLRKVAPSGSNRPIIALALSPDGKYVLSGSGPQPELGPGPGAPSQAATPPVDAGQTNPPPNGIGSNVDSLLLWDVTSGQIVKTIQAGSTPIQDMLFLPSQGDQLHAIVATRGTTSSTISLWDITNAKVIAHFDVPVVERITMSLNKDGNLLLIVGGVNTSTAPANQHLFQMLWDVQSQQIVRQVDPAEDKLATGRLSPDGKTAVSAYGSGLEVIWDTTTGQELGRFKPTLQLSKLPFYSVDISPDNTSVIFNVGEPLVYQWDTSTDKLQRQFAAPSVSTLSAQFSKDGTQLMITAKDGVLRFWDMRSSTLIQNLQFRTARFASAVMTADNRFAVTGAENGTLQFWDLAATPIRQLGQFGGGETKQAAFVDKGKELLSFGTQPGPGKRASQLTLWDVASGKALQTFGEGHVYMPAAMAVSPDGKYALTGSVYGVPDVPRIAGRNDSLILWDISDGKEVRRFETPDSIFGLAFDPSMGNDTKPYLVAIPKGNDVALLDVQTGDVVATFSGHTKAVMALAFSPDGSRLAATGRDGQVMVWDAKTGKLLQSRAIGSGTFVAFSPDSQVVASPSGQADIELWNVATGQSILKLTGHESGINSFAFSTDGKFGASGSVDNTFILWNLTTGELIRRYTGHSQIVWQVGFSPDQKGFFSASNGLIVWRATPITLDEIKAWVKDNRYQPIDGHVAAG